MSQPKLTGISPDGESVPLVATINHPAKGLVRMEWREGYDAAVFTLKGQMLVAIGDGEESWTFRIDLDEGEEILSIARNDTERYIELVTHVR